MLAEATCHLGTSRASPAPPTQSRSWKGRNLRLRVSTATGFAGILGALLSGCGDDPLTARTIAGDYAPVSSGGSALPAIHCQTPGDITEGGIRVFALSGVLQLRTDRTYVMMNRKRSEIYNNNRWVRHAEYTDSQAGAYRLQGDTIVFTPVRRISPPQDTGHVSTGAVSVAVGGCFQARPAVFRYRRE